MIFNFLQFFCVVLLASTLACNTVSSSTKPLASDVAAVKVPVADTLPSDDKNLKTAVFAGGCFWGLEAVFEHIKGVTDVTSGYSGGDAKTADYETVSNGTTGHAESVKVIYDSSKVSYEQLLKVFFAVAHDPTELNRQGPDSGTQYRSAIFYNDDEQKKAAENYIAGLTESKAFSSPIVTQVVALKDFYKAEDYHQNYLEQHPNQPYIVANDQPKVENLQKRFPELYISKDNLTK